MEQILDSGNRREFETGAVRDMAEGKGRCDLLPLDIVADAFYRTGDRDAGDILSEIDSFVRNGDEESILIAISHFMRKKDISLPALIMEVSKHFEAGAKKYDERNWEKGIPTHCYIDSGVRHFLKYIDDFNDERHDRAFVWNMLCLLWTCKHRPELNDLPYVSSSSGQIKAEDVSDENVTASPSFWICTKH